MAAASSVPPMITRAAPMRSASMPANGCAAPQVSWLTAMAKLIVATPRPVAQLIGDRNRPTTVREPLVTASSTTADALIARPPPDGLLAFGLPMAGMVGAARIGRIAAGARRVSQLFRPREGS